MRRITAALQIVIVVGGVFGTVAALDALGVGAGGARFKPITGILLHVVILAVISVTLAALVLREDRVRALGLSRIALPRLAIFTLLGAFGTFVVNAAVVGVFVWSSGGLAREVDVAKEKAAALATLAQIPVWIMVPLAVVAGVYEEIVFRGFLLGRLRILFETRRALLGDVLAIALSSVVFGLGHAYQGALGVLQTTFAGVCLGVLAVVSRSLWPSILTHAGIDAVSLLILHLIAPVMDKVLKEMPT